MANPTLILPRNGPEREALRQKGQFWTPEWVARAMVRWVLASGATSVYDPAVGAGAFFAATKAVGRELGRNVRLAGREVDPDAISQAERSGLDAQDLERVELRDFVLDPPLKSLEAIVANPPYIRHHRLSPATKDRLRTMSFRLFGLVLDGRAGYHVYFLLRALSLLKPGGRLAFILPSDISEGVFASALWNKICSLYRLVAVATFHPEATPFPGVDTNALVVFIENEEPIAHTNWLRVLRSGDGLERCASNLFADVSPDVLTSERVLSEMLETGLSRAPQAGGALEEPLGRVMRCVRGIASGCNEFFLLTDSRAKELALPRSFLAPVLSRTRYVQSDLFSLADFDDLRREEMPVWLLALDGRHESEFPPEVRDYLEAGVRLGLPSRPLIRTRHPWYRMETRVPPPFLFAYLGRRRARFIRNEAGVLPLTGFLCVYEREGVDRDALWRLLQSDEVRDGLPRVGKSYGSGAIKVEPRALERTPIPSRLVSEMVGKGPALSLFETL